MKFSHGRGAPRASAVFGFGRAKVREGEAPAEPRGSAGASPSHSDGILSPATAGTSATPGTIAPAGIPGRTVKIATFFSIATGRGDDGLCTGAEGADSYRCASNETIAPRSDSGGTGE